jgi:hypothetical protein
MSASGPNSLSIVVENCGSPSETVTIFHSAEEAQALFKTLTVNPVASHYLYLEAIPTKELKPKKFGGFWTNEYGVLMDASTGLPD